MAEAIEEITVPDVYEKYGTINERLNGPRMLTFYVVALVGTWGVAGLAWMVLRDVYAAVAH